MSRRRGLTLIELLVASLIVGVVMTGLAHAFTSMYAANDTVGNMPTVNSDLVDAVNRIAGDIRKAPLCKWDPITLTGCKEGVNQNVNGAAVKYAQPTGIKAYTLSTGSFAYYFVQPNAIDPAKSDLVRNNLTNSPVTVMTADSIDLQFQYLINVAGTHFMPADPDSVAWVTSVNDSAELKQIIAVKVAVSITRDGLTNNYSTIVRLRNSPKFVPGMD